MDLLASEVVELRRVLGFVLRLVADFGFLGVFREVLGVFGGFLLRLLCIRGR